MSAVAKHDAVGPRHWLTGGFEAMAAYAAAVRKAMDQIVLSMQMARMIGVLSQMSDRELQQIGITRQQIPAHAEKLVLGKD